LFKVIMARQSSDGVIPARDIVRVLQTAARVGADPADILARAHVPYSLAELAGGAIATLPRRQLVAVYRESIVAIGWHSSQLDRKPQMHPDEFRLMCHCVISCRTLRDVIDRQTMFFRTRGDRLSIVELHDDGPMAVVTMDTLRRRKNFGSFLSDLAGVSIFCRFYAWLLGIGLQDFALQLAYSSSYANDAVNDFFVGDISFDSPVNSIAFPQVLLGMPVVRTPDELEELLVDFPFDFMSARPSEMALADRIRSIYSIALARRAELPSIAGLARLVGQSSSTLRRRLAEEQLSIRSLKTAARRDAVLHMLGQRRRTISEVALATGFRDMNSFRAAFRRWTGTSPARYRRDPRMEAEMAPQPPLRRTQRNPTCEVEVSTGCA
jgi:AraC-like DNA-binding protein